MHERTSAQPAEGDRPDAGAPAPAIVGLVVLALVGAVPLVFVPGGGDAFEPHKAHLLATGAAILLAVALARELGAIEASGWAAWRTSAARRFVDGLRRDPLGAAVLLFVLSAALSTVLSPRPALSLLGNSARPAGLVTACAGAAVYFGARAAAADPRWLERLLAVASLAATGAAGYALVQIAGLDPIDWAGAAMLGDVRRVPGTLGHPNHLGTFLAMTLPAMLHLARRARRPLARAGWAAAAVPAVVVLVLTLSRGAWVALAGAAAAWAVIESGVARGGGSAPVAGRARDRRWLLAGAAALALVFVLPLLTPIGATFAGRLREVVDLRAPTTRTRLLLWRAAAGMAADHPVAGVGTDAFAIAYPRYRVPEHWRLEWNPAPARAHSEPLHAAATQGLVGLAALLLVVVFAARALLRLAGSAGPGDRAGAAAAGAALAAFAVSGLAGFTVAATGTLAAALAGTVAGRARPAPSPVPSRPGGASVALAVAIALLAWMPLVLTPWRAVLAAAPAIERPAGDPARAAALARAVAIAPWDVRYRTELGRTQLVRAMAATDARRAWELLAASREQLERARAAGAPTAEESALLAHVLARQASLAPGPGPLRLAGDALRAALAADSTGAGVLELVAEGYLAIGRPAEARAVLLRCARVHPDFALPLAELGFLALDEGRPGDAADTLALALERNWHDVPHVAAMARDALAVARARAGAGATERPGAAP